MKRRAFFKGAPYFFKVHGDGTYEGEHIFGEGNIVRMDLPMGLFLSF